MSFTQSEFGKLLSASLCKWNELRLAGKCCGSEDLPCFLCGLKGTTADLLRVLLSDIDSLCWIPGCSCILEWQAGTCLHFSMLSLSMAATCSPCDRLFHVHGTTEGPSTSMFPKVYLLCLPSATSAEAQKRRTRYNRGAHNLPV